MGVKVVQVANEMWAVRVNSNKRRKLKLCGPGAKGKKLALQLKAQWDAHLALGQDEKVFPSETPAATPSAYPPLQEAVEEWISRQQDSGAIRGSTSSAYLNRLGKWCWPYTLADGRRLGDAPVDIVTREMLGAMFLSIKAAKRSPSLLGQVAFPLRGFYRELVETKQIASSPMSDVLYFTRQAGYQEKRPEAFTFEEATRLLVAACETEPGIAAYVACGLLGGLRWGEIAALQPGDVVGNVVQVNKTWSSEVRTLHEPKVQRSRRAVKIGVVLSGMLARQVETAGMEAQAGHNPLNLLFPVAGKHWQRSPFGAVWHRLLGTARLPLRGFHATRHSYISQMLLGGADPAFVARNVGDTLATIISVYFHCIDSDRHEAAVNKLDQLIGG